MKLAKKCYVLKNNYNEVDGSRISKVRIRKGLKNNKKLIMNMIEETLIRNLENLIL